MAIKVELSGHLDPDEAMKIISAHIEKITGKKVQACFGVARLDHHSGGYGEGPYATFTGVDFRFVPEDIGG